MRYEILGPLRVTDDEEVVTVSARKMQVLLAALLIRSGEIVSCEQLIAEIWGDEPPRQATAALYVYISQLRKTLERPGGPRIIVTRAPGYVIAPREGELDLQTFQHLVNQGRAAARAQHHADAVAHFNVALDMWRGPAPVDISSGPIITGFTAWLDQMRLECTEKLVQANLELGLHDELIPLLFALIAEHPLHEAFYRQLMLALYRSERRADALQVYRSARTVLHRELGLEPGRGLRELHQGILATDHGGIRQVV
ncbi:AfsR/SARP family transcriptional regulator [Streptomyces sp. NPDC001714]|uniref:AfsR/SARP family transcriptional regulator n=1 Tax=Streptomyces sp. NPDC001714 TaxID=3364603 RepID=UPI003692DE49